MKTIDYIKNSLIKNGITNPYVLLGIFGTIAKETAFIPHSERGYSKTSNTKIRKIFGARVSHLTDSQLTYIKQDDEKFFNLVYGGAFGRQKLGNTQKGDGYKFRGRGFNQLTGRSNYANMGKRIGKDLIDNPDLVNKIDTAAEVNAIYFKSFFDIGKKGGVLKSRLGVNNINEIKNIEDGTKAAVMANAGWAKLTFLKEDLKRAMNAALAFRARMPELIKGGLTVIKKNKIVLAGLFVLTVGAAAIYFLTGKK